MTTLKARLSEGDPAAGAGLSDGDVQEMRRMVVAAAAKPMEAPAWWGQSLAVAALILVMIGAGLFAGRRAADQEPLHRAGRGRDARPGGRAAAASVLDAGRHAHHLGL